MGDVAKLRFVTGNRELLEVREGQPIVAGRGESADFRIPGDPFDRGFQTDTLSKTATDGRKGNAETSRGYARDEKRKWGFSVHL